MFCRLLPASGSQGCAQRQKNLSASGLPRVSLPPRPRVPTLAGGWVSRGAAPPLRRPELSEPRGGRRGRRVSSPLPTASLVWAWSPTGRPLRASSPEPSPPNAPRPTPTASPLVLRSPRPASEGLGGLDVWVRSPEGVGANGELVPARRRTHTPDRPVPTGAWPATRNLNP